MTSLSRAPVSLALIAAMTVFLSGCIAYDAASTVVDAGATVVSTTAHVAGDVVTAPFDGGGDKTKSK